MAGRADAAADPRTGRDGAPGGARAVEAGGCSVERLIEITPPNGYSVRVDQHVDGKALRRILLALRGLLAHARAHPAA